MTKKRMFLGLGLAAALALPAVAVAWPDGEGRKQKMLEKFDLNKDGALDETERAAAHKEREAHRAARHAEMLAKFDANKDGALDDGERAKMRLEMATKRFQMLDTNKDGALSFEEFAAGHEKFGRRHGGRFGGHDK